MNENTDKEMKEFEGQIAGDLGYTRKGKNIRRRRSFLDFSPQRKTLILVGAGIVLLVVFIAIFSGVGNKQSTEDLTSIRLDLDRLEDKLTRLEGMEVRTAFLEKQEKGLQQSIAETDRSGGLLTQQMDKLTQRLDSLEKRMAMVATKTEAPYVIQRKPISLPKGRYHKVNIGENLYRISLKYDISLDELCRLNNMTPGQFIHPGQKLLVAPESHQ